MSFNLPDGLAFASADEVAEKNTGMTEHTGEILAIAKGTDGISSVPIMLEPINDTNKGQTAAEHAAGLVTNSSENSTEQASTATVTLPDGTEVPAQVLTVTSGSTTVSTMAVCLFDETNGFLDFVITGPSEDAVMAVVPSFGNAS